MYSMMGPDDAGLLDRCWGAQVSGNSANCTPGFRIGKGHFKNKFCEVCRTEGILVSAACVRRTRPSCKLRNEQHNGFWNHAREGFRFRLVNQTAECSGGTIVVSPRPLPDSDTLEPFEAPWEMGCAGDGGFVRLMVSKGTLVPEVPGHKPGAFGAGRQYRKRPLQDARPFSAMSSAAATTTLYPDPPACTLGPRVPCPVQGTVTLGSTPLLISSASSTLGATSTAGSVSPVSAGHEGSGGHENGAPGHENAGSPPPSASWSPPQAPAAPLPAAPLPIVKMEMPAVVPAADLAPVLAALSAAHQSVAGLLAATHGPHAGAFLPPEQRAALEAQTRVYEAHLEAISGWMMHASRPTAAGAPPHSAPLPSYRPGYNLPPTAPPPAGMPSTSAPADACRWTHRAAPPQPTVGPTGDVTGRAPPPGHDGAASIYPPALDCPFSIPTGRPLCPPAGGYPHIGSYPPGGYPNGGGYLPAADQSCLLGVSSAMSAQPTQLSVDFQPGVAPQGVQRQTMVSPHDGAQGVTKGATVPVAQGELPCPPPHGAAQPTPPCSPPYYDAHPFAAPSPSRPPSRTAGPLPISPPSQPPPSQPSHLPSDSDTDAPPLGCRRCDDLVVPNCTKGRKREQAVGPDIPWASQPRLTTVAVPRQRKAHSAVGPDEPWASQPRSPDDSPLGLAARADLEGMSPWDRTRGLLGRAC